MADSSEKMLRRLLNLVSGSSIDTSRLIQQLALIANNEKERFALRQLCMDVESGAATVTIVNAENVPIDKIQEYAKENGTYAHSLRGIDAGYNFVLIDNEKESLITNFISEYKDRIKQQMLELEKEEEEELELELDTPDETEEETSQPEITEEEPSYTEEIPENNSVFIKSKEKKKETAKKKQQKTTLLYNKTETPITQPQKTYHAESRPLNSSNAFHHNQSHSVSYNRSSGGSGVRSETIASGTSLTSFPQAGIGTPQAGIGAPQKVAQQVGLEKKQSVDTYKMTVLTQHNKISAPTRTTAAVSKVILSPVDEIKKTEGAKELQKYSAAYQLATGSFNLASAHTLKNSFYSDMYYKQKAGHFSELNKLLKTNGKSGISFADKESFESSVKSLFNAGSSNSLAQLGLNPYTTTTKQMQKTLMSTYKLDLKDATKVAKDIMLLRDTQNTIKTVKSKSKMIVTSVKTFSYQSLKDNEGATAALDGLSAVLSIKDFAGETISFLMPSRKGIKKPISKGGSLAQATQAAKAPIKKTKVSGKSSKAQLLKSKKKINPAKAKPLSKAGKTKKGKSNLFFKSKKKTGITGKQISKITKKNAMPLKSGKLKVTAAKKLAKAAPKKAATSGFFKFVAKISETIGGIKKYLYIGIAALVLIEVILVFVLTGGVTGSMSIGFFEYDGTPNNNVMDSITGHTYVSLLKAEKNWAQGLMNLGTLQSVGTNVIKTSIDDISYTLDNLSAQEYAAEKGLIYDAQSKTIKDTSKEPFPGAPAEAYKAIGVIDGGVEVTFVNGNGTAIDRTSNIQDILSMSPVFFQQNFGSLTKQEGGTFLEKVFAGWLSTQNAVSNVKKSIKGKWNEFVGDDSVLRLSLVTKEDINNSMIERLYAETLFYASHKEAFEMEFNIFPIGTGESQSGTFTGPITQCTHADENGCHTYDNFYYLEDGSLSGDNATAAGDSVTPLEDTTCLDLTTDEEKAKSNCWTKESVTVEEIKDGKKTTKKVDQYIWACAGGHSGKYCGGHITLNSTGIIYTITQDQLNGTIVGKVPENNPAYGEEIKQGSIDEEAIKTARDIFDIDMAIKHVSAPETWNGWTRSNMEWAINIYNQDWNDLYGIQTGSSIMYETTFGLSEIARILSELSGVTVTESDVNGLLNGTLQQGFGSLTYQQASVVAQAYYWVGNIGYDQFHHGDPLKIGGYTDCSGFASRVWQGAGINIPLSTSATFYGMSSPINDAAIVPGDLLVRNGHVVIFVGKEENGDYIFIESNVFPGRGKRGPGNIFRKTRSLSNFLSKGYRMIPISSYY